METRNKWITILFLVFIFILPAITLADRLLDLQSPASVETFSSGQDSSAEDSAAAEGNALYVFLKSVQGNLDGFTDELFMRKQLIYFSMDVTSFLTGGSYFESTQVLPGKDDWLFYKAATEKEHPLWDYMGINHYTDEELAQITANLKDAQDFFQNECGVSFYIVSIPNKELVYSEKMPDTVSRLNKVSRGQQLAEYMEQNTDLPYLDLRQVLLEAKEENQVYFKTDSHWNYIGAFIGLQEIFQEIYGNNLPVDASCFSITSENYAGDLAALAGRQERYAIDTYYELNPACVDPAQYHDQVLLLVGDSFSEYLYVLARYYYKEAYYVHSSNFQAEMIEQYNPDIVIWESVERYLDVFKDTRLMEQ